MKRMKSILPLLSVVALVVSLVGAPAAWGAEDATVAAGGESAPTCKAQCDRSRCDRTACDQKACDPSDCPSPCSGDRSVAAAGTSSSGESSSAATPACNRDRCRIRDCSPQKCSPGDCTRTKCKPAAAV